MQPMRGNASLLERLKGEEVNPSRVILEYGI